MNPLIAQINNYEWMPYKVPTDVTKQAEYFAKILSVPKSYIKSAKMMTLNSWLQRYCIHT